MTLPFQPRHFYEEALEPNGITSAFGVPDSSIKGLLSCFSATKATPEHIVTANEGGAVALAAGFHLSTGKVALVYMQNSGFTNALNPIQSLAAIFGIPMLRMVGWRGQPVHEDEPQHSVIGAQTLDYLKMNMPYEEMPHPLEVAKRTVARLVARSLQESTLVALLVLSKSFMEYKETIPSTTSPAKHHTKLVQWTSFLHKNASDVPLSRELAIRCLLKHMSSTDIVVSSTSGNNRELYIIRKETRRRSTGLERNFFCIGSMGHTLPLPYGISIGYPAERGRVFCIEGNGSFLMHVGNNAVLTGISEDSNVIHVVIYNGVHQSTGSQPLMINRDNFLAMAEGLAYKEKFFVDNEDALGRACETSRGNTLIVVALKMWCERICPVRKRVLWN